MAQPAYSASLGQDILTIRFPEVVTALAWSPDGTRLAASNQHDNKVYMYDLVGDHLLWSVGKAGPNNGSPIAFDRTGRFVITSSTVNSWPEEIDKTLTLLDADNGQVIRQLAAAAPDDHARNNIPTDFAVSPDKEKLAVILGVMSGRVAIYDTSSWTVWRYLQVRAPTSGAKLAINAAKHTVTILNIDGEIQVWDYANNSLLKQFRAIKSTSRAMVQNPVTGTIVVAGSGAIMHVRIAPGDGKDAFVKLEDDQSTLVSAWNPFTGDKLNAYHGPGLGLTGLAVSLDGRYVAATRGGAPGKGSYLLIWDADTGVSVREIYYDTGVASSVAFSEDSRKVAVAVGGEVRLVAISK